MKTLQDYKQFEGQIVKTTSANDYSTITGKCIRVRECIDNYTDITKGIRHLADIENNGAVKVAMAQSMEIQA